MWMHVAQRVYVFGTTLMINYFAMLVLLLCLLVCWDCIADLDGFLDCLHHGTGDHGSDRLSGLVRRSLHAWYKVFLGGVSGLQPRSQQQCNFAEFEQEMGMVVVAKIRELAGQVGWASGMFAWLESFNHHIWASPVDHERALPSPTKIYRPEKCFG